MDPLDHNKVRNGFEAVYRLHKVKGRAHVANLFKNSGVSKRIRYVLRNYQAELQASIIKMMDGLPAKIQTESPV